MSRAAISEDEVFERHLVLSTCISPPRIWGVKHVNGGSSACNVRSRKRRLTRRIASYTRCHLAAIDRSTERGGPEGRDDGRRREGRSQGVDLDAIHAEIPAD
jgi:hypothetical protein